jgi:hypothetical protein
MESNPYKPPTARVADLEDGIPRSPAALWFRRAAVFFAVLGMVSGVLFAIGPFYFGTPHGSLAEHIGPGVLSLFVVVTHWLNFKRLRDPYASSPRGRLITFNILLLAFFALGFVGEYELGENFRNSPGMMAGFILLGILPFAANALYLCLPWAKTIVRDSAAQDPATRPAGSS